MPIAFFSHLTLRIPSIRPPREAPRSHSASQPLQFAIGAQSSEGIAGSFGERDGSSEGAQAPLECVGTPLEYLGTLLECLTTFYDFRCFELFFSHHENFTSWIRDPPPARPGISSQLWGDFMEGFRQNALAPSLLGPCWANLFQV